MRVKTQMISTILKFILGSKTHILQTCTTIQLDALIYRLFTLVKSQVSKSRNANTDSYLGISLRPYAAIRITLFI